jgi:hypothetical protein
MNEKRPLLETFKRIGGKLKTPLIENAINDDPILKKYGFERLGAPNELKGGLVKSSDLNNVTVIAYFNNNKWNLPTDPFDRNEERRLIQKTLGKTLAKYLGGKLKSIWNADNADLPPNVIAIAMTGADMLDADEIEAAESPFG